MPDNKKDKIKESPVTYNDYAVMPDDGNRYEIADGVLELMSPGPSVTHQMISSQLQFKLMNLCQSEFIVLNAPFDMILSDTEVRQPDLIMVHRSRMDIITHRGIEGPPDLVVEIMSPFSIRRDKVSKLKSYAKHSIHEYWIVDPSNNMLEKYFLKGQSYELADVYTEDETVQSERIPCVSFTMNEIMSQIPVLRE
jgi:Uma2 family endonuclease